ncbi:cytochrome P450 [Sporichthya sp.]|uniref:cytochrome P450 n=1 Tax=Sporichthya sp. TaxID=65475 RepID=UPI0018161D0D|nr:cytochrome P450 [Sporichthya sp.]MBA3741482.1 cytochrome P450 [Sporichthya sp.]
MQVATSESEIKYDPFDPASQARAFELYAQLRDEAPVYKTDAGYWAVSRYADVKEIFTNPERFSSSANQAEGLGLDTNIDPDADPEFLTRLMTVAGTMQVDVMELFSARAIVAADPPHHTRLRRIVNRGFVPRRIAELQDNIAQIVESCLEGIGSATSYEVVSQLAVPLPVRVISDLLSVDRDSHGDIKHWSDLLMEAQGPLRGTPRAMEALLGVFKGLSDYFVPLIEDRRTSPQDDLLSDLVRAAESDILTTAETLLFILSLMAAGNETTTSAISSLVVALKQNPDQEALLLEKPELLPNAVEEIVRYRAPIQVVFRTPMQDEVLSGVTIPAGATIAVLIGAANLDPRQFPDADQFDITRDTSSATGFGQGVHYCLGAHLARTEIRTAMAALLPHLERFRLSDQPLALRPSYMIYNLEAVELVAR